MGIYIKLYAYRGWNLDKLIYGMIREKLKRTYDFWEVLDSNLLYSWHKWVEYSGSFLWKRLITYILANAKRLGNFILVHLYRHKRVAKVPKRCELAISIDKSYRSLLCKVPKLFLVGVKFCAWSWLERLWFLCVVISICYTLNFLNGG